MHIIKSESRFTPAPPRAVIASRRAELRGDASMFPGRAGNTAQVRRKNSRLSLTENKQNTTVKKNARSVSLTTRNVFTSSVFYPCSTAVMRSDYKIGAAAVGTTLALICDPSYNP